MRQWLILTFISFLFVPTAHGQDHSDKPTEAVANVSCDTNIQGAKTCPSPYRAGGCKLLTDDCGNQNNTTETKDGRAQK